MRNLFRPFLACILAITVTGAMAQASSRLDMIFDIDPLGNARITFTRKLPAADWDVWVQNYGNNPSAMKREMQRGLPAMFLEDFQLEKQDMERTLIFRFKAFGACKVDKKGRWTLETNEKEPNLTELNERKYLLVSSAEGVQQNLTVNFPPNASNVKVDKNAMGKTIFRFDLAGPSAWGGWNFWAGLVVLLLGLGLLVRSFMGGSAAKA